ncbi:hypothetical protein [Reyranella soli]|uniref:Uncharacterized protein n=1 Tax=Reyranella soli TaxID=1230389 RepID=A0A512NJ34_9HYPH|nr:hypothetical protein [Reyranella soli]GEP58964.1 hypothetical protein RSO01_61300 [Reyranella soli]
MEGCPTKVLFEEYDPSTGYVLAFRELSPPEILEVGRLISKDLLGDEVITLDQGQAARIGALVNFISQSKDASFQIQTIALPKDLPYLNHANRELALMRAGKKPLSVFSGWEISEIERDIYSRLFDPLVNEGIFVRQEYQFSGGGRLVEGSRFEKNFALLYALKQESWRIPAYRMLRNSAARSGGWSNDYERLFGTLLGYNDEENDAWLRRRTLNGLRWGYATLYVCIPIHLRFLAIDKLLAGLFSEGRSSIDIYISEEGIEPVLNRLENLDQRNVLLARVHMSYRYLSSFYALSQNLGDQFGPFKVDENNVSEVASILEGPPEILDTIVGDVAAGI